MIRGSKMNNDAKKSLENKMYSIKKEFYEKHRKPFDINFFVAFCIFVIVFYCYIKGYFINLDSFIKGIFS